MRQSTIRNIRRWRPVFITAYIGLVAALIGLVTVLLELAEKTHSQKPPAPIIDCSAGMGPIPVGEYKIHQYVHLAPSLRSLGKSIVRIDKPFSIQIGEVTVREFQIYMESLDASARTKLGIGADWEKEQNYQQYPDDYPAFSVPWKAAQNYARWVSQKTSCASQLPSRDEWAAAVIHYATFQSQQPGGVPQVIDRSRSEPHYLLDNLREWSRDACESGHFLLGEDYLTKPQDIIPDPFSVHPCWLDDLAIRTIGFRLITRGRASGALAERGERR